MVKDGTQQVHETHFKVSSFNIKALFLIIAVDFFTMTAQFYLF